MRAAVSEPDRNSARTPSAIEQRREAGVVLAGEDLGRGHERRLPSGAHGAGERDGRDRRLAAADVALEQPAHRPIGTRGRSHDRLDRRRLVAGQLERQGADDLGDARPRSRSMAGAATPHTRLARLRQCQLEGQQLVEGEPVERLGHVGRILREVGGSQGIVEGRQPAALRVGERILSAGQRALQ